MKKSTPENKKLLENERRAVIGSFGQNLARVLIPGSIALPPRDKRGDLYCPSLDGYIEVKMASNRQQIPLRESQLTRHLEYDCRHFYLIIGYRNVFFGGGNRTSLMNHLNIQTEHEMKSFLAAHVNEAYLIETTIFMQLAQVIAKRHRRVMSQMHYEDKIIRVNRKTIRGLVAGEQETNSEFSLVADEYHRRTEEIQCRLGRRDVNLQYSQLVRVDAEMDDSFDIKEFEATA